MKNKKMYIIVMIVIILVVFFAGTYSLLLWSSADNTEVTLRIGDIADVVFSEGKDINVSGIGPVFDYEKDGEKTTFSVTGLTDEKFLLNVNLNITTISDNLKSESFKYVLLSSDDKVNYSKVAEGSFVDSTNNSTISLVTDYELFDFITYKLIIYIDGNMNNSTTMQTGSLVADLEVFTKFVVEETFNSSSYGTSRQKSGSYTLKNTPLAIKSVSNSQGTVSSYSLNENVLSYTATSNSCSTNRQSRPSSFPMSNYVASRIYSCSSCENLGCVLVGSKCRIYDSSGGFTEQNASVSYYCDGDYITMSGNLCYYCAGSYDYTSGDYCYKTEYITYYDCDYQITVEYVYISST